MVDLNRLGAFPADPTDAGVSVEFDLYLPDLPPEFEVDVLVIHSADRFVENIQPVRFSLTPGADGVWTVNGIIQPSPGTSFGRAGRYLYRFQLRRAGITVTDWFADPFCVATDDVGVLSAFDTPASVTPYQWQDDAWKVPGLDQLVVYELHVEEFNATFDGLVSRLPYLRSLGVTCLELLPITSLQLDFDWGYGPLHYFAPNQRWGGAGGLKRLVDACHAAGAAVILDVVFQHTADTFAYNAVYRDASNAVGQHVPSPMIARLPGPYGPQIDYSKPFALDFARHVTHYWLTDFHIDGFRYDEAGDLVGRNDTGPPTWEPLASILADAYETSIRLSSFTPSGGTTAGEYSRIIQVPEYLDGPAIFDHTLANASWQDNTLYRAEDAARTALSDGLSFANDDFPHALDAGYGNYPSIRPAPDIHGTAVDRPVAPFQYINSHDHSHLVSFLSGDQFLTFDQGDINKPEFHPLADRNRWFKLQPFVIALFTASGIPMLWQGQEFTDNYVVPGTGGGDIRTHFQRNVHWEYFYDSKGSPLVSLHRRLARLRAGHSALRGFGWYYFYLQSRPDGGVFAYHRFSPSEHAIVALNFSDTEQTVTVPCPSPGTYTELVDSAFRPAPLQITATAVNDPLTLQVPSNYGYIFCTL
jgi:maltooligosyltrehalose trehalohydrolase